MIVARDDDKTAVVGVPGKGDAETAAKPSGGVSPADTVVSQAKAAIGKRGGRGPSQKTKDAEADLAQRQAMAAELEKVFTPEMWAPLVRAPADLRLAQTGYDHWKLSDQEVQTMAQSASHAGRYFMRTDPKWVVLTLAIFNIGTIYGGRVMLDFKVKKDEAALKAGRHTTDTGKPTH